MESILEATAATSIKLHVELENRVRHLAELRQMSADMILVEAVTQYVERQETREGFQEEAAASWAAYKTTGRHLTNPEVRGWLGTWGTEAETDPPECHD